MGKARRDTIPVRFWPKVRKTDLCWIWTGSRDPSGYGQLNVEGLPTKAHRIAYELLVGPIPAGLYLDHLCRNPPCVNPDHLEPVTRMENFRRGKTPVPVRKLTDQQVREIRYRRTAGERGSDLAIEYGVTQQAVCNLVKGRLRTEAGGPLMEWDGRYPMQDDTEEKGK